MIDLPPPPPAVVSVAPPSVTIADCPAFVRDFRRDFPELDTLADVQVLASAQDILDTARRGTTWPTLLTDVQVSFGVADRSLASRVLFLTICLLAPDRMGHLNS